jgi:RNA polymerase sigma-70 factor (ECF subfamily)
MSVELVQAARKGDQLAFEALVLASTDRLYAVATLVLRNRQLAEEAVQETLVRAWRSLPSLRDAERFDAWLKGILIHACLDAAREARRQPQVSELPMDLTDGYDLASQVVDRDAVSEAFGALSPAHRAAFALRHYEGQTIAEIAKTLGVPLGTAKSRVHYAERAMARAMDADVRWAPAGGAA